MVQRPVQERKEEKLEKFSEKPKKDKKGGSKVRKGSGSMKKIGSGSKHEEHLILIESELLGESSSKGSKKQNSGVVEDKRRRPADKIEEEQKWRAPRLSRSPESVNLQAPYQQNA